jgi:C-terminal processing protease CtpA/Prc
MTAPDLPHRILALFRLWSTIDRFYPYRHLIGDWNAVLREFIPRFDAASDADQYARVILELTAHIEDGHTSVWGPRSVWDVIGVHGLPIEVRSIENRFIVTAKRRALPAEAAIAIGDEVVSIDGENMSDRVRRLWKYFTGSHELARMANVIHHALRGPRRSVAEIAVRGADGKTRVVTIARTAHSPILNDTAVWRILDGNLGYVDLTRLTIPQIEEAFAALSGTKAIIFDMRGYPNGTGWSIAARIHTRNATIGAIFRRPEISVSTFDQTRSSFVFEQMLPDIGGPKYTGRTVMLIDDRTMSQAEQTGLWFEAANGTKFIGSHSAGANGDMTNLVLPGGIYVSFSGHEVRHADGRPLQRIGLVPDVPAEPTMNGIRAGKDEVLDRAMSYLRSGK